MKKAPSALGAIQKKMAELGFDEGFASAVTSLLDTDFVAERMFRFLNNARPRSMQVVADELITLIEERGAYRQKHIDEYYRRQMYTEGLFLESISINWDVGKYHSGDTPIRDTYIGRIPALRSLDELLFTGHITFFTGENGSGKSTLLEAIAIAEGLNPEGGTKNYHFSTYDDYSRLREAVRQRRGPKRAENSYFLRAESFYNMASAAMTEYNYDGMMKNYHSMSHGESFLEFIQDNSRPGLYLMDEPEAALSPQRQLTLLLEIYRMAGQGSQFIIATHSPILLGTPGADIYSFDGGSIHPVTYEETESYRIMKMFLEDRESMLNRLLR